MTTMVVIRLEVDAWGASQMPLRSIAKIWESAFSCTKGREGSRAGIDPGAVRAWRVWRGACRLLGLLLAGCSRSRRQMRGTAQKAQEQDGPGSACASNSGNLGRIQ